MNSFHICALYVVGTESIDAIAERMKVSCVCPCHSKIGSNKYFWENLTLRVVREGGGGRRTVKVKYVGKKGG